MASAKNKYWVIDPFNELVSGFETEKKAEQHAESEARMTAGCEFIIAVATKVVKAKIAKPTIRRFSEK